MANEINIQASTGLTVSCQLYSGSSTSGSPFSATEIGTTGVYVASVAGGTAKGIYLVLAYDSNNNTLATGNLYWTGSQEVTPIMYNELWEIGGFDASNPATNTATSRVAADINLGVAGYGTATTIVTRT